MPLPARTTGHGRRPQWPLAAAWAASLASLVAVALFPRPAAHAYGLFLLAASAGALAVVLAYARLLRRDMTPPRMVVLIGGPWEGQMLLTPVSPMPEELWLVGMDAPACRYRHLADDRDRPQLRVLRYEPADGSRSATGR